MKVRSLHQTKKTIRYFLAVALISCVQFGCDVINPAEPVPAYIHIDSSSLITNYTDQGTNLSNFSDAWISVDGNFLGAFEFPLTVPVIGEGSHKISIRSGVLDNGISGVRKSYTKTSNFDTIISLEPNHTYDLFPRVSYLTGTVFAQLEDFDDGSLSIIPTSANTSTFVITPSNDPNALEGNSGYIHMDSNHSACEFASSTPFALPISVPVYVELNYKCSQEFTIGVFVTSLSGIIQSPVLNLRATSVWKKVYINLSDGGGIFASAINYKVYIQSNLASGSTDADIYLDNLKVLY